MPFADRERVNVSIQLEGPLRSTTQADAVLGRVFAVSRQDVLDAAPPYWRRYFATQTTDAQGLRRDETLSANVTSRPPSADNAGSDGAGNETIVRLGDAGLIAPKPQFTPEPDFTDAARRLRFQGRLTLEVVVDTTGKVSNVQVVRPIGLGLDENAVNSVSTWRFTPATLNGKAVPVAVPVEVDFHLGTRITH